MGLSDGEEHVHEIDPAEGPQPVEGAPA